MLKITVICILFASEFIVYFDGVVKCATTKKKSKSKTKTQGRHYDPNPGYEPYWPGGHWVLYGDPDKPSTKKPPEICGDECHYLYQEVGPVCGREIDNIRNKGYEKYDYSVGYQTFESYCEFMDKACKSAGRTKPAVPRWIFVHRGPCIDNHNKTYYKQMYGSEPIERLKFYLTSVADTFLELGRTPPW